MWGNFAAAVKSKEGTIAAELMLGKVIAVVFLMATAEEWTSRESDSLPEEGMATTADIVAVEAEKIPSEGRLCSAGEKPDVAEEKTGAAMWESIFWVLADSMRKRNTKYALIPT